MVSNEEVVVAEVDVTPAMLRAGLEALHNEGGIHGYDREDELALAKAFMAMLCASRREHGLLWRRKDH